MEDKVQELLERYRQARDREIAAEREKRELKKALADLAPHKVGDVVRWVERNIEVKFSYVGNRKPQFVLKKAVCSKVNAEIYSDGDEEKVRYSYNFNILKKDGTMGMVSTFPRDEYQWTGKNIYDKAQKDIQLGCGIEFPHFGASYPDAKCINGWLWDLDSGGPGEGLSIGGDDPCPICNTEAWLERVMENEEFESREAALQWRDKIMDDYLD